MINPCSFFESHLTSNHLEFEYVTITTQKSLLIINKNTILRGHAEYEVINNQQGGYR